MSRYLHFVNAAELVHERLAVFPRLLGRDAVAAAVRSQHAERPASGDTDPSAGAWPMNPPTSWLQKEKPLRPNDKSAAQFGGHALVGALRVAAPVQRIALAAGPGAARPDDVLAGDLLA